MVAVYKNPFISRVQIKNFRNFVDTDVTLTHKQVIVGENNVGKTNFIRAIQLILDKDFSDNDRQLVESDFHDGIDDPLGNGTEIVITIQIQGYEHNQKLVAQLTDAVISTDPPTLQITYRFYPNRDENENIINYNYVIYKGKNENNRFTNEDRSYLNIFVIKALRDVERELKSGKKSPLYKLVQQYEIANEDLADIAEALEEAANKIIELDEIVHIKNSLADRFNLLSGVQMDSDINLRTFDIDTERLLYTLQIYMGMKQRPISELSLGLANVLYVSLMLLLLRDKTINPVLQKQKYEELLKRDTGKILPQLYEETPQGKFVLRTDIDTSVHEALYEFMDQNTFRHQAFTILAVEEPEAHLHPILQRLIYREVLHNSNTSVIFTSHSTHITSVTPIDSIVHVRRVEGSSKVFSTANVSIDESEISDIERYLDAKRGEIFLGKGIVLVEGITEEYLVPNSASLLEKPLDSHGIVLCNINSTNFRPFVQILNALNIPWVLLTDGDFYTTKVEVDSSSGMKKTIKTFHILADDKGGYYLGNEIIRKLLTDLKIVSDSDIPDDFVEQDKLFQRLNCFIGHYTYEVDVMEVADEKGINAMKKTYEELKSGGQVMLENFESAIDKKDFWSALTKIDANIGKGRFAQRLASKMNKSMIPSYVEKAIKSIVRKVKKEYE